MTLDHLTAWLMIVLRSTGLLMAIPVLAGRPAPVTLRMGLSVALATLLYGIVPQTTATPTALSGLIAPAVGELILGLGMGFVLRMIFATIEFAGRIISTEIGLAAIPGVDTPVPSSEALASLLSLFAGLLFFLVGAHHGVLRAFALSFEAAPAGAPLWNAGAGESLVRLTGHTLELGIRMAAPFLALNFIVSLGFAVLSRAVPRLNLFALSFSVRVATGLLLLSTGGVLFARYLTSEFNELPFRMLELLPPAG